ncbi:hypothetical protein KNO15_18635 [Leifsonia shinshuensis]|uniref:DUF5666 domain-containing protein n=1 Tax=Leifsonia shinshuensis TaxID=150026 RepID=UPI001F5059B9|nr:DUF5666 domain-containing protein [Leifsonia shinshuensis]MCI0158721.1 hypothetical protein [Leifsonia shinshuensis]
MDDTRPTEPLPPQQPQNAAPQQPYASGSQQYAPGPQGPTAIVEPFYKRHGLAFAISTLVLAVILLIGIAGAGAFAVGSVLFHRGFSISHEFQGGGKVPIPVPGQGGTGGGGQKGGGQNGRQDEGPIAKGVVRGSVTKIDGSTWTITTARGASLTVDTSSSTAYGAPGQSQKASDFAVGDEVIVIGERSGGTVTANRILKVADLPVRPPSVPGSSATPGATPGS